MRAATPLDQPRAMGKARLSTKVGPRGTCIDALRQSGALKMLFPRNLTTVEAIIVNTAGGITGGDEFTIHASAGEDTRTTLTTQAAERVYRAQPDQVGRLTTTLDVSANATLHWVPQETILYNRANLTRRLSVNLAPGARFVMAEAVIFGRRAMGERIEEARFSDRVEIQRAGVPLYRDGTELAGNIATELDRPAVAAGASAMANLIWVGEETEGNLTRIRDLIGTTGGASMIQQDTMAIRLLAEDSFALRRRLVPALDLMTGNALPLSWRL